MTAICFLSNYFCSTFDVILISKLTLDLRIRWLVKTMRKDFRYSITGLKYTKNLLIFMRNKPIVKVCSVKQA